MSANRLLLAAREAESRKTKAEQREGGGLRNGDGRGDCHVTKNENRPEGRL